MEIDKDNLSEEFNNLISNNSNSNINNVNIILKNNSQNINNNIILRNKSIIEIKNNSEIILETSNVKNINKYTNNNSENNSSNDIINLDILHANLTNQLSAIKEQTLIGEIITFKYSDFNAYIDLKINNYKIGAIFWGIGYSKNPEHQKFKSGDKVKLNGIFGINKKKLNLYFNIKSMNKIGTGNYLDNLNQLRVQIYDQFMHLNKKKISYFPFTIGIITALGGAAIQDILETFRQDKFVGTIIIKNAIVQGASCPKSLISSIKYFENNNSELDILLITRGGGSHEDLVGFSDWNLILKVHSTIYTTISAVGHQIDNQLIDDVSDYKFATPSIAAKFIVETQKVYYSKFNEYRNIISNINEQYINAIKHCKIITNNYHRIINDYDTKEIKMSVAYYSSIIRTLKLSYTNAKNKFYNTLTNLKPSIFKINEVTSIYDFIDQHSKEIILPKKIEIIFSDGRIKINYNIEEYDVV